MPEEPSLLPLPNAGISKILGLLEVLDDLGEHYDVYRLAKDVNYEHGDLLEVVKASEMLSLTETPKNQVVLLNLGKRVIEASVNEKKQVLRDQMLKIPLIQYLISYLEHKEDKSTNKKEVVEVLSTLFPDHNPEEQFRLLVGWGRYGEIFCYDIDIEGFYLDEGDEELA